MKKIKAFFTGLKVRLRKWWTSTLIPVKRVVMLCSLLSIVAFGVGSCSAKKPYQTASAAESDSTSDSDSQYLYSSIDFDVNYAPQLYVANGSMTVTKIIADFSFRAFNDSYYLVKGYESYDLANYSSIDSPEIPLYYYYEDGDSFSYAQCFVRVSASRFYSASDLLKGNLTLTSVAIRNVVSDNYLNMFSYEFYAGDIRVLSVTFSRNPKPSSGFNFTYVSSTMGLYPWVKLTVNYTNVPVSSPDTDSVYQEGYNSGYQAGRTNGYSDGLSAGKTAGYNDGYADGKSDGASAGYEEGYSEGYSEGKADGDTAGYLKGFNAGVKQGYQNGLKDNTELNASFDKGYQAGYNKGISETLDDVSPWGVLVNGVDTFFNAKIFGTISIGLLCELGLGIILFGFVVKMFFGG